MTSADSTRVRSAAAGAAGPPWTGARIVLSLSVAFALTGLAMLFVDAPLARAVARLPEWVPASVAAATDDFKGAYFMALALAVAALSMLGSFGTSGELSRRLRALAGNAAFVFAATLAALVVASLLKFAFGRARPELLAVEGPHAFVPFSTATAFTSFPSGETMMAVAFFGACARLALPHVGKAWAAGIAAPALLLAASRPIVGAHYLSDVLAGILLAGTLVVCLDRARRRLTETWSSAVAPADRKL